MIVDQHHRNHNYLRISLTDIVQPAVRLLHAGRGLSFMPGSRLMQPGEIEAIGRVFAQLGVSKNKAYRRRTAGEEGLQRYTCNGWLPYR